MIGKILTIDDDKRIIQLIKATLEKENFKVISAKSADEGIEKAREAKPELILLDLMLPGVGGLELCRILKQDKDTAFIPIVILTGVYVKPENKIEGLETGADDYLTKPFHPGELVARVKAILRRIDYKIEPEKILESGDIRINLDEHTVHIKNKLIELRLKEFDLLYLLMRKKGRVLNKDFLCESVWGYEYFSTTHTIEVTIARLREKLGKYANKIETIEGIGYKFTEE
ncbi:response regulator transcription factor [bacterium]|nr:response regulator transcription factor [bacterium]